MKGKQRCIPRIFIDQIVTVGPCTRPADQDYFSYRAAPQGRTGRQLSFIAWPWPGSF